jgi:hypothetical protein
MYIRKNDFTYFEGLHNSLDVEKREIFMGILLKTSSKKAGEDVGKIQIIDDSIFDERGIEPHEFITRTMIKKAFKAAKEEV